jgi:hypothetical protein
MFAESLTPCPELENIDPPASSYAIMPRARPYGGENPAPGRDVRRELDPMPGIREQQPRPFSDFVRTRLDDNAGVRVLLEMMGTAVPITIDRSRRLSAT